MSGTGTGDAWDLFALVSVTVCALAASSLLLAAYWQGLKDTHRAIAHERYDWRTEVLGFVLIRTPVLLALLAVQALACHFMWTRHL
tara:strand:+ start:981 stop:1238 length:258 start_codon:yes stop_codon:yes gene_type:complete